VQVHVEVVGGAVTHTVLRRLVVRAGEPRREFESLLDQLIEAERLRFAGTGARWRKLAPSTVREKARLGLDPRPMSRTGQLRDSLSVKGNPRMRVKIGPGWLRFGTTVWYARFHQRGAGVPKRTVIGLTRVQKRQVMDDMRAFFLAD
jgi:hypothetical protein